MIFVAGLSAALTPTVLALASLRSVCVRYEMVNAARFYSRLGLA